MDKPEIRVGEALGTGLVLDALLIMFSGLILCAEIPLLAMCVAGAHWTGNALILIRRARKPTRIDIEFFRFGMLVLGSPFLLFFWYTESFS